MIINVHVMNILLRMIMPNHLFLTLPIFFFFIFNILIVVPSAATGDDNFRYSECRSYYDCGLLKNISYPFWATGSRPQHCGRDDYELTCREDQFPVMKIEDQDFLVLNLSRQFYTMTIARSDLWDTPCTDNIVNTTLDYDRFSYVPAVRNLTLLYGCQPGNMSVPNSFTCKVKGTDRDDISYYVDDPFWRIRMGNWTSCYLNFRVPIMWEGVDVMPDTPDKLKQVLKQGFQVGYEAEWELCRRCVLSNGTCGSNSNSTSFVCYCGDGPRDRICSRSGDSTSNWKRMVVVAASAAGSVLMICVTVRCIQARKQIFKRSNNQDLEAFIRTNGPLAVKRHKFSEIRKMTKSFKDKLGQGGYGDVYKGNLLDGSPVAVKVLKASKGSGEDFINEVASISRTSHVNVVTLLGYCFEGQNKALIYEFMPNGSLEKYTYNENALQTSNPQLEVEQLLDIVIGIARGLEYLHLGCNTRILHFDIKPHNILLDENFCPKISDFGLSKLCLNKESIMSMLDARGTIGYISPEVFCRNFGGVSVKSDVYSYGMMVLEMVGGRKNINARASHTSDVCFPDWVHKQLEMGSSLGLPNGVTEEENELVRKMILVGFWCIQTKPSDRPSMSRVIEMLQGSIEALQIPPKPVLTFPPPEYSTLSLTCSFLDLLVYILSIIQFVCYTGLGPCLPNNLSTYGTRRFHISRSEWDQVFSRLTVVLGLSYRLMNKKVVYLLDYTTREIAYGLSPMVTTRRNF